MVTYKIIYDRDNAIDIFNDRGNAIDIFNDRGSAIDIFNDRLYIYLMTGAML